MIYNKFKLEALKGSINFTTDTIKVALTTSSYIPDIANHLYFSDITNEVVGVGYTAGGKTLTNPTVTQDNIDNEGVFDADNVTWTSSTITARYAVIYKYTGTASTSPLISVIDFATDRSSSAGDFTINWASEGIINAN